MEVKTTYMPKHDEIHLHISADIGHIHKFIPVEALDTWEPKKELAHLDAVAIYEATMEVANAYQEIGISVSMTASKLQDYLKMSAELIGASYNNFSSESKKLPGMDKVANCPVRIDGVFECRENMSLYALIQHINDNHKWSREDIASWLRTLPFDLTFKSTDPDKA